MWRIVNGKSGPFEQGFCLFGYSPYFVIVTSVGEFGRLPIDY